ncbi:MAG TPA: addiction module protein [Terriglobia bacterium]|nr:addiction module protein [Terriglobia bacterium]
MSVEELENEALKLERRERARLAEKLLSSLEALSPAEAERLWADEALRRLEEIEQGKATSRPAEDVLREARSRLA